MSNDKEQQIKQACEKEIKRDPGNKAFILSKYRKISNKEQK